MFTSRVSPSFYPACPAVAEATFSAVFRALAVRTRRLSRPLESQREH